MRGKKKSPARGKPRKPKPIRLLPSQRTLLDYVVKTDPNPMSSGVLSQTSVTSAGSQPPMDIGSEEEHIQNEIDYFQETESRISHLVHAHQLNEIVALFQMRDQLRFSNDDLRRLYRLMQRQMVDEFGAPIASSLFSPELTE
jgi:hypothetical protein